MYCRNIRTQGGGRGGGGGDEVMGWWGGRGDGVVGGTR